jgi:hypothetical protein
MSSIRDIAEAAKPIAKAPDGRDPIVVKPKKEKPRRKSTDQPESAGTLPEDCPVVPLGLCDNQYYYLDAVRQMRVLTASDHARLGLLGLFNQSSEYLWDLWPRTNNEGATTGWRPELVAECLMSACARKGVLDVVDRVRGPGAWKDDDGGLVIHAGDIVYHAGAEHEPGPVGRHIYPSAPEKPKPAASATTEPAETLLTLLRSWNWRRADVDPMLLLGWIGASMLGGALSWRPMVWITGDKATGKSTLHEVLKGIHGPGGMIHATDPTAAGLWQSVGHASLPIALDELESEADNRKNANIIKLARHAASGGTTLRGGSDHKGTTFTARSCFLFSSILIPPMLGQDISRLAVLQLDKLTGKSAPRLEPRELAGIGAALRRRLIEQWPRHRATLDKYKDALQRRGHTGRSSDQFGALLACADLMLYDHAPETDGLDAWGELLKWSGLAEAEDDIADSERCIGHLLSSKCEVYKDGKQRTVGSWIEQAADKFPSCDLGEADRVLGAMGLRVERPSMPGPGQETYLLVANTHNGLRAIFKETNWGGLPGGSGVWVQSMRRIEGSTASKTSTNFGGAPSRFTRIPLSKIYTEEQGKP